MIRSQGEKPCGDSGVALRTADSRSGEPGLGHHRCSQRLEAIRAGLKGRRSNASIVDAMGRLIIRRLCAALFILAFVAGLPMQGAAMSSATAASPAPWSAGPDVPAPGSCVGCSGQPDMGMFCPIVFCIGLSAVVSAKAELSRPPPDMLSVRFQDTGAGLSLSPDPYPPRTSVHF